MEKLEHILSKVLKPAQYTGGEYNQIIKEKDKVSKRVIPEVIPYEDY